MMGNPNPNLSVYVAECDGGVVGNTCMTIVANLINDCRPAAFVEPMLVADDGAHAFYRSIGFEAEGFRFYPAADS